MRYRYSFKTLDTTNLVSDPGFATGCGAGTWICDPGWNIAAGQATFNGVSGFLSQANVYRAGGEYTIQYKATTPNQGIRMYVGGYKIDSTQSFLSPVAQTIRVDNLINLTTITDLIIDAENVGNILDNVFVWEWTFDDPIETEPGQWDQAKKVIICE
jgi:hypothetical protein